MLEHLALAKNRLHHLLEISDPHDNVTKIFNGMLFGLIILNVLAVIIESTPQPPDTHQWLHHFEVVSMWIFTLEYFTRIWTCNENPHYAKPLTGRLRYSLTPLSLVDFLTILPFWLHMAGINVSMLRMLRFFRLLKFARLVRYSKAYRFIANSLFSRKDEFLVSFFMMLVTLLVASSLMYFAEHEAQPKVFSSIPDAFWWGVITFTSVGYGDIYPVTIMGKIMGGLFAIVGIGIFALPTAILTAGMLDQIHVERKNDSLGNDKG